MKQIEDILASCLEAGDTCAFNSLAEGPVFTHIKARPCDVLQAMCRLQYVEQIEDIARDAALHAALRDERLKAKQWRHWTFCQQVVNDIVDLAVNVGEYRELTHGYAWKRKSEEEVKILK